MNVVRSLFVDEANARIGTLKHLTNNLKIVKKEPMYEVVSLKYLTKVNELELLHSSFSKNFALNYFNSLKIMTHVMSASAYLL